MSKPNKNRRLCTAITDVFCDCLSTDYKAELASEREAKFCGFAIFFFDFPLSYFHHTFFHTFVLHSLKATTSDSSASQPGSIRIFPYSFLVLRRVLTFFNTEFQCAEECYSLWNIFL